MGVKEHYDTHLGDLYSWMTGDFRSNCDAFKKILTDNGITPSTNRVAIDLGSGHGIQSVPLAERGFQVLAVDFNQQLLNELKKNAQDLNIKPIKDDIRKIENFPVQPELVVCCGDTLAHLDTKSDVRTFIEKIAHSLEIKGKFILSFRDYSTELKGKDRFIPVKSDENKILTCVLEYENEVVQVTDVLYSRTGGHWEQKVSSYKKVRLRTSEVLEYLEASGMAVNSVQLINRLTTVIATKEKE